MSVHGKWANLSKGQKSKVINILVAYIATVMVTIAAYIFRDCFQSNEELFFSQSNWDSFIWSLVGGLVIFTTIGITSFFIGLPTPHEVSFGERIRYLFNNRSCSEESLTYIEKKLSKLRAYITNGTTTLTIVEYDQNTHSFILEERSEFTYLNMTDDQEYIDDQFTIDLTPDCTGHNVLAEVSVAKLNSTTLLDDKNLRLYKTDPEEKISISATLSINSSSTSSYELVGWIRQSANGRYWRTPVRYAEKMQLCVKNSIDQEIGFKLVKPTKHKDHSKKIILNAHHSEKFFDLSFAPDDSFEIEFCVPKPN